MAAPAMDITEQTIVTVTDPEEQGKGMSQFTTYKVNICKKEGDLNVPILTVVRRYSDFSWLREVLFRKFPGIIVPPIPEKQVMGRFSAEFVEKRRRGLELFLERIVRHPILRPAEDAKSFLTEDDKTFQNTKENEKKSRKDGKGLFSFLVEGVQSISNTFGSGKDRMKTENDVVCDEIELYASSLETALQAVLHNTDALTKRTKELATAWFEFGLAFTLLGQYESEQQEAELGNAFSKLGRTADKLSVLHNQKVEKEVLHFEEAIEDYLLLVTSIKQTMKVRRDAQLAYHNQLSALEAKQAKLHGLQGKAPPPQIQKAQAEVAEEQKKADDAKGHLAQMDGLIISEMKRFRENKAQDFKLFITDFIQLQLEYHQQIQQAWEKILPDIEALQPINVTTHDETGTTTPSAYTHTRPSGSCSPTVSEVFPPPVLSSRY